MKNKYWLASAPLFLGILSLMISGIVGARLAPDGTLIEPAFFLIPLSFLFFFSGIVALAFVGIVSAVKKNKRNS